MKSIGIIYSSIDGQTRKISEFLAKELNHQNFKIHLSPIDQFSRRISEFDAVVIGCSIRYGKHHDLVLNFIKKNLDELETTNSAFFSVNLVARKADKDKATTNPYLIKFLKSIDWKPDLTDVFAGSLEYKKYGLFDKLMIKAIMKFTNGPTSTPEPIEYTNWNRVMDFAERISLLARTKSEIPVKNQF